MRERHLWKRSVVFRARELLRQVEEPFSQRRPVHRFVHRQQRPAVWRLEGVPGGVAARSHQPPQTGDARHIAPCRCQVLSSSGETVNPDIAAQDGIERRDQRAPIGGTDLSEHVEWSKPPYASARSPAPAAAAARDDEGPTVVSRRLSSRSADRGVRSSRSRAAPWRT